MPVLYGTHKTLVDQQALYHRTKEPQAATPPWPQRGNPNLRISHVSTLPPCGPTMNES